MHKVLVTGGCGYIGSHTIADLIIKGYEVVCIDNLSRSNKINLEGIYKITGINTKFYEFDLCDSNKLEQVFAEEKFESIIHFAAFKSVNESVAYPMLYYRNNLVSIMNLLEASKNHGIKNFIFSSSCSVYGNIEKLPVTENSKLNVAESPYGSTKQIGETMINDFSKNVGIKFLSLRYFNPAGAHDSNQIGEIPYDKAYNLVPAITQCALLKKEFYINGNDYPTRDGTCVRDYIHIMDLAEAHSLSISYLNNNSVTKKNEVINLGSGNGISVKEMVIAFEDSTQQKLHYSYKTRRVGDVIEVYADNKVALQRLKWTPKRSIHEIMNSSWLWELKMKENRIGNYSI